MQFSPTSCHFISLRTKYSPQHRVLKHPQSVFLQRPSFIKCRFTWNNLSVFGLKYHIVEWKCYFAGMPVKKSPSLTTRL
jgi:hypothetical protein